MAQLVPRFAASKGLLVHFERCKGWMGSPMDPGDLQGELSRGRDQGRSDRRGITMLSRRPAKAPGGLQEAGCKARPCN